MTTYDHDYLCTPYKNIPALLVYTLQEYISTTCVHPTGIYQHYLCTPYRNIPCTTCVHPTGIYHDYLCTPYRNISCTTCVHPTRTYQHYLCTPYKNIPALLVYTLQEHTSTTCVHPMRTYQHYLCTPHNTGIYHNGQNYQNLAFDPKMQSFLSICYISKSDHKCGIDCKIA